MIIGSMLGYEYYVKPFGGRERRHHSSTGKPARRGGLTGDRTISRVLSVYRDVN